MSSSQSNNFFSQINSQLSERNTSTYGQINRRLALKVEWTSIASKLNIALRPHVLRYAKLSDKKIVALVKNAIIEDVDSDHMWFKRGVCKVCNNQSTWKFRTLSAMEVSCQPSCQA